MRTKVETGDSASIWGIFDSLKRQHRDMSANWNFCVIGQETWSPLIQLERKTLCEKGKTHLLYVSNESALEKACLLPQALDGQRRTNQVNWVQFRYGIYENGRLALSKDERKEMYLVRLSDD